MFERRRFSNGMPYHVARYGEAVTEVLRLAEDPRHAVAAVVTPNIHHFYLYSSQPRFREAYEQAALSLLDGMPLVWVARHFHRSRVERVAGSDIFMDLLRETAARHLRVYLLGAAPGVAERAVVSLGLHPLLGVTVFCEAPAAGFDRVPELEAAVIGRINAVQPHLLFVALGAPRQELWIHKHRSELDAHVALGVGGAFDFAAGVTRRAPPWMQSIGLEWCHRLAHEPRRLWRRYLTTGGWFLLRSGFLLAELRRSR